MKAQIKARRVKRVYPSEFNTKTVRINRAAYIELMRRATANETTVPEEIEKLLGSYVKQLDFPMDTPLHKVLEKVQELDPNDNVSISIVPDRFPDANIPMPEVAKTEPKKAHGRN